MDWNIARPQRLCSACERELEELETYVAALYEEGEEFVRKDFCEGCWPKAEAEGGFFSRWRTAVPAKEHKRRLFADDEVLVDFFMRLEHDEEEQRRHFFYLLALILMRKKILKFEDIERADDREYLVLRYPPEDRTFRVRDPKLTEEQIEGVKDQLSQILDFRV
jgi:hypothetical protein